MQVFNALQTITTKIWVAFILSQGNILKGSDDKIKKDENIKDTRKITKRGKRWEVKGWVSHIGNVGAGMGTESLPCPTSAGGVVDAGPWQRCELQQSPMDASSTPGPMQPVGTAGSACTLTSAWTGIWKAIEWHPPCYSPLCPAMDSLACASAPQAQICYMFPSGISKGARRTVPRILDTGIS